MSTTIAASQLTLPATATYASAELTECILSRLDVPRSSPLRFLLAYGVLEYRDDPFIDGQASRNLVPNGRYVNLGDGMRLHITQSQLTVAQADALVSSNDSYASPHGFSVSRPGLLNAPVLLSRSPEHPVRSCLPRFRDCAWLREYWHHDGSVVRNLDRKYATKIVNTIRAAIGVDLGEHPERWGNFLALYPDRRVRVHLRFSKDFHSVGIELETQGIRPEEVTLHVSAKVQDRLIRSHFVKPAGRYVIVDFWTDVDEIDLVVVDDRTNTSIYHLSGHPMRTFNLGMSAVSTFAESTWELEQPGGGAPKVKTIKSKHGSFTRSVAGAPPTAPWITRNQRRRPTEPSAYFRLYQGTVLDRQRAVTDLQTLIHGYGAGRVWIWDPYFGPDDIITFVPHVFDRSADVRILTALSPPVPPSTEAPVITERTEYQEWSRDTTIAVLERLRSDLGFRRLQCKVSRSPRAHDRFLVIDDSAFQLGCSFNHIGAVVSTISEVSVPRGIIAAFEQFWSSAERDL